MTRVAFSAKTLTASLSHLLDTVNKDWLSLSLRQTPPDLTSQKLAKEVASHPGNPDPSLGAGLR